MFKYNWKNGIIWMVSAFALSEILRWILWYFGVNVASKGGEYLYPLEFSNYVFATLMFVPAIALIVTILYIYNKYYKLAAAHPTDLPGVARGAHGKPGLRGIGFNLLFNIAYILVGSVFLYFIQDLRLSDSYDQRQLLTYVFYFLIAAVFDIILLAVGNRFLKPSQIQLAQ